MPERFRGRLLLRRPASAQGSARLSRAAIPATARPPATRVPWPRCRNEVNALARGVILDLVLRQLEADQMLEGRVGDGLRAPSGRTSDRRPLRPRRPCAAGQMSRTLAGRVAAARFTRTVAWTRVQAWRSPGAKLSTARPTCLAATRAAAAQRHVEIGQHDLSRRARIAPQRDDREGRGRDDVIAGVLAGRAKVGDRRASRRSPANRCCPAGLNRVMSPVPAGMPAIGQALRTA